MTATRSKLDVAIKDKGGRFFVWVDKRFIGEIIDGWFTQKTTSRHIFRQLNYVQGGIDALLWVLLKLNHGVQDESAVQAPERVS